MWECSLSGQVWTKCPTRPDTQGAPRGGCSHAPHHPINWTCVSVTLQMVLCLPSYLYFVLGLPSYISYPYIHHYNSDSLDKIISYKSVATCMVVGRKLVPLHKPINQMSMWCNALWTSLVCFLGSAEPNVHTCSARRSTQTQYELVTTWQVSDFIYHRRTYTSRSGTGPGFIIIAIKCHIPLTEETLSLYFD